jgi:hypothetical protein
MHAPLTPPHRSPVTSAGRKADSTPYLIVYNEHTCTHSAHKRTRTLTPMLTWCLAVPCGVCLLFGRLLGRSCHQHVRLIHNMRDGARAAQWHARTVHVHAHTRTQPMSICSLIRHLVRLCYVQTLPVQARVPHRLLPSAYMSIDGCRQVGQACSRPTSTQVRTRACTHAPTHGTPPDSSQPALICGYNRLPRQRK